MSPNRQLDRIRVLLPKEKSEMIWPGLYSEAGKRYGRLTKKNANRFFVGCIIDYQIPAKTAWLNAQRLVEETFAGAEDVFDRIAKQGREQWLKRRKELKWLHRFPAAHARLWRIAQDVVGNYHGDAREIWRDQTPATVRERLARIKLGEQLSHMTVGALIDAGHLNGSSDLKADIHVRRVLGRLIVGEPVDARRATELSRALEPENPWRLDSFLFTHGKTFCCARPDCGGCSFRTTCAYACQMRRGGR